MSAEPFAALVFGGTSELPSSAAFILSARAGAANATVAPSPSITSMVLVFDMVLSLWTLVVWPAANNENAILFPKPERTLEIFSQLMAGIRAILLGRSSR